MTPHNSPINRGWILVIGLILIALNAWLLVSGFTDAAAFNWFTGILVLFISALLTIHRVEEISIGPGQSGLKLQKELLEAQHDIDVVKKLTLTFGTVISELMAKSGRFGTANDLSNLMEVRDEMAKLVVSIGGSTDELNKVVGSIDQMILFDLILSISHFVAESGYQPRIGEIQPAEELLKFLNDANEKRDISNLTQWLSSRNLLGDDKIRLLHTATESFSKDRTIPNLDEIESLMDL